MTTKFLLKFLSYGLVICCISDGPFANASQPKNQPSNQTSSRSTSESATAFGITGRQCREITNIQRENVRLRLLDAVSGYLTAISVISWYDSDFKSTLFNPQDFQLIIKEGVNNRVRDRALILCDTMQDAPIAFAIQKAIVEEIAAAKLLRAR